MFCRVATLLVGDLHARIASGCQRTAETPAPRDIHGQRRVARLRPPMSLSLVFGTDQGRLDDAAAFGGCPPP